jgi:hypothetical protein
LQVTSAHWPSTLLRAADWWDGPRRVLEVGAFEGGATQWLQR